MQDPIFSKATSVLLVLAYIGFSLIVLPYRVSGYT